MAISLQQMSNKGKILVSAQAFHYSSNAYAAIS